MKLIVAGSRSFADREMAFERLDFFTAHRQTVTVVCGMATGADLIGKEWALARGHGVIEKPADWERQGRAAGFIRNGEMAMIADALVAFWDGKSRGTKDMIDKMNKMHKPVRVVTF